MRNRTVAFTAGFILEANNYKSSLRNGLRKKEKKDRRYLGYCFEFEEGGFVKPTAVLA
jgi:hypothetical protein